MQDEENEENSEESSEEEIEEDEVNIKSNDIKSQSANSVKSISEIPKKLIIMLIPKTNKDLSMPLNTLYFFIELFGYENNIKKLTDEDNNLVFYLMNINWLDELKTYYNYKCIEFIINRELKKDKNFFYEN